MKFLQGPAGEVPVRTSEFFVAADRRASLSIVTVVKTLRSASANHGGIFA